MITVGDVFDCIDRFAPFDRAADFDNPGLLAGERDQEARGVLVSLDMTDAALDEARERGANLLVTHHPIIFHPLKKLSGKGLLCRMVREEMAVICAHTNLDVAPEGVSKAIVDALALREVVPLEVTYQEHYHKIVVFVPREQEGAVYDAMTAAGAGTLGGYSGCAFVGEGTGCFLPGEGSHPAVGRPGCHQEVAEVRLEMICPRRLTKQVVKAMLEAHPYELPAYDIFEDKGIAQVGGFGGIGSLIHPMSGHQLASYVKGRLGCGGVRYYAGPGTVSRVAFCGGSGGNYVELAAAKGAQALVTGDVKHDQFLLARELGLTLIDAGHFATENPVLPALARVIRAAFPALPVQVARSSVDTVSYL